MKRPSDRRLLAMCLVAATVAFYAKSVVHSDVPALIPAIAILAALMFVDGYFTSARSKFD